MKFHHLGIFVNKIHEGIKIFKELLNIKKSSKVILDKKMGVKVVFLYDSQNICYEIVSPYGKKNPVSKVIKQGFNILNHIAYKVKKFDDKIIDLRKKGYAPIILPIRSKAFNNKRVCFFLTPLNFIIELIEDE
jgi:hypothetical protein